MVLWPLKMMIEITEGDGGVRFFFCAIISFGFTPMRTHHLPRKTFILIFSGHKTKKSSPALPLPGFGLVCVEELAGINVKEWEDILDLFTTKVIPMC